MQVTQTLESTDIHGLDKQRDDTFDFQQYFRIIDLIERLRYEIDCSIAHGVP